MIIVYCCIFKIFTILFNFSFKLFLRIISTYT